jgi:nucleoside-diphosphate kinase
VTERTLVLIKPDAMARRLAGEILARYERKSLAVLAMDLRTVDDETAGALYAEHVDWFSKGTKPLRLSVS